MADLACVRYPACVLERKPPHTHPFLCGGWPIWMVIIKEGIHQGIWQGIIVLIVSFIQVSSGIESKEVIWQGK
jgi:hypothetical protein